MSDQFSRQDNNTQTRSLRGVTSERASPYQWHWFISDAWTMLWKNMASVPAFPLSTGRSIRDAEQYWNIIPPAQAENVVHMAKA